jgi:hypothetical protein
MSTDLSLACECVFLFFYPTPDCVEKLVLS